MQGAVNGEIHFRVAVLGDVDAYYTVSCERIAQMPTTLQSFESLVLCPFYSQSSDACVLGARCRHVHADVEGLVPVEVHVNYAWRSLEEVSYPRYPGGVALRIAAPNCASVVDTMDSSYVLVTRALAHLPLSARHTPLIHCAHYYFNRQCNLGADCRFVHAVYVDPLAPLHRRAPAPIQLGRMVPAVAASRVQANMRAEKNLSRAASSTSDGGSSHDAITPAHDADTPALSAGRRIKHCPYAPELSIRAG